MTKHFRLFLFPSFLVPPWEGFVLEIGCISRRGKGLVIGFGVVISKLEYYTIIFCINILKWKI